MPNLFLYCFLIFDIIYLYIFIFIYIIILIFSLFIICFIFLNTIEKNYFFFCFNPPLFIIIY